MSSLRASNHLAGQLGTLYSLGTVGSLPDGQLMELFLARDDPAASEAAFSALVDRHGAMVWSVCQRALQNSHDAHDAFQATFLILVRKVLHAARFEYVMKECQALVAIKPGDVAKVTVADVVVAPGRTQQVRVVGPGGRPVTGTRVFGRLIADLSGKVSRGAQFTFIHTNPGKNEVILVVNPDETAGRLVLINGNEPDPISVTLQTAGTVTGRLVDEEGRPRRNVPLVVMQNLKTIRIERFSVQPPTGPDGRFRISGLIPGVYYNIETIRPAPIAVAKNNTRTGAQGSIGKPGWTVMAGEIQNWGDVRVKNGRP